MLPWQWEMNSHTVHTHTHIHSMSSPEEDDKTEPTHTLKSMFANFLSKVFGHAPSGVTLTVLL